MMNVLCRRLVALLGYILAVHITQAASIDENQLAVVVNNTSFTTMVSSNDLRLMLLGDRNSWPDGKKVSTIMLSSERPEFAVVLKAVLRMSPADFKRYFMQANFTGKSVTPPREAQSPAALKAYVSATPGAIGFVRASDVDSTVKIVKVDGAAPGDPGYKLEMH